MYSIYKIEIDDYIYIGSTCRLSDRQNEHNYELRKGRKDWPLYKLAREKSINYLNCIKIEDVEKHERYKVERYYIEEFAGKCLNERKPNHDTKLYYQQNKEKYKLNGQRWRQKQQELKKLIHQQHLQEVEESFLKPTLL